MEDISSNWAENLRQKADEIARTKKSQFLENMTDLLPEKIQEIAYELSVHQIELEMQNEELRRTQAGLEIERERYFEIYNLAPVGYCTVGENGLILEANLALAAMLGITPMALARQQLTRFISFDDQDIYYRCHKQLFETGIPQTCDLRLAHQNGNVFWAHLMAAATQDVNSFLWKECRLTLTDITERKKAEGVLKDREDRLREVLENSLDASYKHNLQTNAYDHLSPVFFRISGYSPQEM